MFQLTIYPTEQLYHLYKWYFPLEIMALKIMIIQHNNGHWNTFPFKINPNWPSFKNIFQIDPEYNRIWQVWSNEDYIFLPQKGTKPHWQICVHQYKINHHWTARNTPLMQHGWNICHRSFLRPHRALLVVRPDPRFDRICQGLDTRLRVLMSLHSSERRVRTTAVWKVEGLNRWQCGYQVRLC